MMTHYRRRPLLSAPFGLSTGRWADVTMLRTMA
jgi:hypothetical protein